MEEKVKAWIQHEYESTKKSLDNKYSCSIGSAVDRCYGVVMFAINNLFKDYYNTSLAKWWDDEMLPKFIELEMR